MKSNKSFHGKQRGLGNFQNSSKRNSLLSEASSKQFEGKFGRLLPLTPANFDPSDLKKLAEHMIAEPDLTPETETEGEENLDIAAGYTYLGQFMDHDLTFDPTTPSQEVKDVNALVDYRTPAFDLDNMYGRGPEDQPYLYEDGKFILGEKLYGNPADPNTHDLQRNVSSRGARHALIGDPRNDENIIVSQLQGIFLRFHNAVVDYYKSRGESKTFDDIRDEVRWHYQWMIINDFLPTIIRSDVINKILPHLELGGTLHDHKPALPLFKNEIREPYMPIEFSVAAYRFGHSMVRPLYRLNGYHERMFIFPDLVGFDAIPDNLAIDWRLFFKLHPDQTNTTTGPERIQPSYKIDTSLVDPLGHLPMVIASQNFPSLAERNLVRGNSLQLPSGQDVAKYIGVIPIRDEDLMIGKASPDDAADLRPITDISKNFAGKAPLWFYILAEAMQGGDGNKNCLGEVGGHIIGETFIWLMVKDSTSVFGKNRVETDSPWTPIEDFQRHGRFGIAELILRAQKA